MNKLIIISAPSGAGKTTIVREIMKSEELKLMFSVSATSRKPREHEIDGKDYYFLTVDEFNNKIKNQEFIEWEEVYNNQFYGTLKSEKDRVFNLGFNMIFDVDVKGGINIKKQFPKDSLSIFIKPPSIEELENRLRNRGTESQESLEKRIKKAEFELAFSTQFDQIIVNDDLQKAIDETLGLIKNFIKN